MFKSIRWRLQAWHAVVLLLTIAGFGAALYFQIRRAQLDEIDSDLHAAARALEATLRTYPPPVLGAPDRPPLPRDLPPAPPGPLPPPPVLGVSDRPPPSRNISLAPPGPPHRRHDKHHGPPPPWRRPNKGLALPEHFRQRFRDDAAPYFVVWLANGKVFAAVPPAPPMAAPALPPLPAAAAPPYLARQRGDLREVAVLGPFGTRVLVGRSITKERAALARLGWQLGLTGLAVLLVGLAGGWLLSARAVRPIRAMSATAAAISASNLSRRIDLAGVDSELGQLAEILNAMFTRLEAAFERQARFTADASHELRTPLAVIHSHAELALAKPRPAEEYREALETCLRAAQRMRSLVEGLLTLARADAGTLEVRRDRVDLGTVAGESVALAAPLARQMQVGLALDVRPVEVTGDSGRLAQVVTNLLANAINYNRPGGEVSVTVQAVGTEAILAVADTGCGISEEDCAHIFERFYRVDKARSRALGGSGLGLAICKSIVEAHGGSINFTTEVNRGTTFLVRLPLAQEADPILMPALSPPLLGRAGLISSSGQGSAAAPR